MGVFLFPMGNGVLATVRVLFGEDGCRGSIQEVAAPHGQVA